MFNSDQMKRLQSKIKAISEDTNMLRMQINGQVNEWNGGLPIWNAVQQAQQQINKLTEDAEKLTEVVRKAIQGAAQAQLEAQQGTNKWLNSAHSMLAWMDRSQFRQDRSEDPRLLDGEGIGRSSGSVQ